MEKLDQLKQALHPAEKMSIVDQCAIVAEALAHGSPLEGDKEGVAMYLDISQNQVYKMEYSHKNLIPEMKNYLRTTDYKTHTTYDTFALMTPEAQRAFLDAEKTLDKGVYEFEGSDRTIIGEDERC